MSEEQQTTSSGESSREKVSKISLEELKQAMQDPQEQKSERKENSSDKVSKISKDELDAIKNQDGGSLEDSQQQQSEQSSVNNDDQSVQEDENDTQSSEQSEEQVAAATQENLESNDPENNGDETNVENEVSTSNESSENQNDGDDTDHVSEVSHNVKIEGVSIAETLEAQKVIPSAKDIESTPDDLVIDETNGTYTSNLDFVKNTDVRRVSVPVPKWPFFVCGGIALLTILIVSIVFIINQNKPEAPVVLTKATLNVSIIDAGYVGEKMDLRGVYFECEYSDGTKTKVFDIEQYITEASAHFNAEGYVVAPNNGPYGYVKFVYSGQEMMLRTKTYAYAFSKIESVQIERQEFVAGEEIDYGDLIVTVLDSNLGLKVLSISEMMESLKAYLDGTMLDSNATGFVIPAGTEDGTFALQFEFLNLESSQISITVTQPEPTEPEE